MESNFHELEQEFKLQFREQTGQDIVFVHIPVLGIPYPVLDLGAAPVDAPADAPVDAPADASADVPADAPADAPAFAGYASDEFSNESAEYLAWLAFITAKGEDLIKASGIEGSKEVRIYIPHKCWGLWMVVTWYENLYCTIKGGYIPMSKVLTVRDMKMKHKMDQYLSLPDEEKDAFVQGNA